MAFAEVVDTAQSKAVTENFAPLHVKLLFTMLPLDGFALNGQLPAFKFTLKQVLTLLFEIDPFEMKANLVHKRIKKGHQMVSFCEAKRAA